MNPKVGMAFNTLHTVLINKQEKCGLDDFNKMFDQVVQKLHNLIVSTDSLSD